MIRTDCEAIVRFYNNMVLGNKRSSRRRWLNFHDRILSSGTQVLFESIKGQDNTIADILSRPLHQTALGSVVDQTDQAAQTSPYLHE